MSKVDFYDQPIFGEEVEAKFPEAINDIRDAGVCYAVGCSTAVVHHCMGVVQVGLIALANDLGLSLNIHLDTWENIIAAVERSVEAKRVSMHKAEWKEVEHFYSEATSDLRAIKNAWRNPTAHFRRRYDEQEGYKVVERTKE